MSGKKIGYPLLCAVVTAAMLAGCGLFSGKNGNTSAVPAGFSQPSASSSAAVSDSVPETSSEGPVPSVPENSSQGPNEPSDSQPGQVLTIETDDKNFNEKFAANPIDEAYIAESNDAVSTLDMLKLSNQYSDIWKTEADHAYSELEKFMAADSGGKPQEYKAEQGKWLSDQKAALQKIANDAQAAGGSMAQVDAASQTMDYYRSRAAQLYRELYGYDEDYTYAYTEDS